MQQKSPIPEDAFDCLNLILKFDGWEGRINREDFIASLKNTFKTCDYWCKGIERNDHVFSDVAPSKIDLTKFYLTFISFLLTNMQGKIPPKE